jgi:hypothetical protein|tara:strand:- start:282 stop:1142 length:861 start_codon:yes stop_codon:yes gene_type:complete
MDGNNKQTNLHTDNTRRSVPVYRDVFRSWFTKSHDHPKGNRSDKRNRHYKHLLAISGICLSLHPTNAFAEGIGGVSATASPIANSSGSVTNQAIQVLQGPYITNTYGGGIQCQGPTRNFTPFLTGTASWTKPYEGYYNSPVYDMRDLDDDGAPDNPGDILYHVPTRTGQKDNYSLSAGFSMTWSTPLDKELQQQCKDAAAANIAYMLQNTANKRLDFEIARLKNCGSLMKEGIMFHPKSPYYSVCADVVVQNVNNIAPHAHSIPKITPKVSNDASVLKEVSIGYGK